MLAWLKGLFGRPSPAASPRGGGTATREAAAAAAPRAEASAQAAQRPETPLRSPAATARAPQASGAPATAATVAGKAAADAPTAEAEASLLRRTEVLDRDRNLLGYSFELREELTDRIRAPGRRVRDFIDGLLVEQLDRYGRSPALAGRESYVRVWDGFLGQPALERLAGLRVALLIQPERPNRPAPEESLVHLALLRETSGLRIVLDHNEPGPWLDSMLPLADAALFRMGFCAPEELSLFARHVERRRAGLPVWAWDVATTDDFELAHRLGCEAFSGAFVLRRENWCGNSLSPHSLHLATLLDRLRSGVETHEIAAVFKHDMALAYRLLRYVNAAAWGLNKRITSVEQAIVLLGQQPLQRWVSMMLIGSARSTPGAAVVMEAALVRARFLELLGATRGERDPAAQLFILGLFSMLDVALKVPLGEALAPLKLSETMQDALLRQRGPMAPYLELALAVERGDAERLRAFADVLGVSLGEINRLQFEALDWVQAAEA